MTLGFEPLDGVLDPVTILDQALVSMSGDLAHILGGRELVWDLEETPGQRECLVCPLGGAPARRVSEHPTASEQVRVLVREHLLLELLDGSAGWLVSIVRDRVAVSGPTPAVLALLDAIPALIARFVDALPEVLSVARDPSFAAPLHGLPERVLVALPERIEGGPMDQALLSALLLARLAESDRARITTQVARHHNAQDLSRRAMRDLLRQSVRLAHLALDVEQSTRRRSSCH